MTTTRATRERLERAGQMTFGWLPEQREREFERLLYHEILPSIRRKGFYHLGDVAVLQRVPERLRPFLEELGLEVRS